LAQVLEGEIGGFLGPLGVGGDIGFWFESPRGVPQKGGFEGFHGEKVGTGLGMGNRLRV